jgi:hypothetical protein
MTLTRGVEGSSISTNYSLVRCTVAHSSSRHARKRCCPGVRRVRAWYIHPRPTSLLFTLLGDTTDVACSGKRGFLAFAPDTQPFIDRTHKLG